MSILNVSEGAEPLMVVFGLFRDNHIELENGEVVECITYQSTRKEINNKYGFFHLKIYGKIKDWTIFQYVLVPE